jgi:hypothetical protein
MALFIRIMSVSAISSVLAKAVYSICIVFFIILFIFLPLGRKDAISIFA